MLELYNGIEQWSEAWQAYGAIVRPDMNVAVVGPSTSFFIDPVLFYVSYLLRSGSGTLHVIDPKSDHFPDAHRDHDLSRRVAGAGNASAYLRQIERLIQIGVDLKIPQHVEGSHILDFHLPLSSLDVICDHNTSPFIVSWEVFEEDDNAIHSKELLRIYQTYYRYLKPGGSVILQSAVDAYGSTEFESGRQPRLSDILLQVGFRVEPHFVDDRFVMPMPRYLREHFVHEFVDQKVRELGYFDESKNFDDQGLIVDLAYRGVQHPSPYLLLAQK